MNIDLLHGSRYRTHCDGAHTVFIHSEIDIRCGVSWLWCGGCVRDYNKIKENPPRCNTDNCILLETTWNLIDGGWLCCFPVSWCGCFEWLIHVFFIAYKLMQFINAWIFNFIEIRTELYYKMLYQIKFSSPKHIINCKINIPRLVKRRKWLCLVHSIRTTQSIENMQHHVHLLNPSKNVTLFTQQTFAMVRGFSLYVPAKSKSLIAATWLYLGSVKRKVQTLISLQSYEGVNGGSTAVHCTVHAVRVKYC